MIFVSHATPEENEFARWVSLQLAGRGFEVWSDVTKLIGGEKFWSEIETAIGSHTTKFLLCVSKHPVRAGVLRELDLAIEAEARKGQNLIVPLKIDETPFSKFPRDLGSKVNAIRFDKGWAAGLSQVLAMLERDGITPNNSDGPAIVRRAWNEWFPVDEGLRDGKDLCVSNLFPTIGSPEHIWYHPARRHIRRGFKADNLPVLAEPYGNGLVSFCGPLEIKEGARRFAINTQDSLRIHWKVFIADGISTIRLTAGTGRRIATALLRRAFHRAAEDRGFSRYDLANDKRCYWLQSGFLPNDEGSFNGPDGKCHNRALVGYKTLAVNKDGIRAKRLWHFAVQGVPAFEPREGMILKTHVVFTSDGKKLYGSDASQHRARRSQAKNWWNDVWRDRMLTMANVLGNEDNILCVEVAENRNFEFSLLPLQFNSCKTYIVIDEQAPEEFPDEDDGSEVEEGDEQHG